MQRAKELPQFHKGSPSLKGIASAGKGLAIASISHLAEENDCNFKCPLLSSTRPIPPLEPRSGKSVNSDFQVFLIGLDLRFQY
jgi:hypothetical protein